MKLSDLTRLPFNYQISITAPAGRNIYFRFRYREGPGDPWKPLSLDEIDIANQLYRSGACSIDMTMAKLKDIRTRLYKLRAKPIHNYISTNLQILNKLWETVYTARKKRNMKRPECSWHDYIAAIDAAGDLPLDTCDLRELEECLDEKLGEKPNIHARRIIWINSILLFLGRDKIAPLRRKHRLGVTYVNESEFLLMVSKVEDVIVAGIMRIAFYTGLRLGEIFALESRHVREDRLIVESQMCDKYRGYSVTSTKTDASRDALLPPIVREQVLQWVGLPKAEKLKVRDIQFSKVVGRLCETLWPGDVEKQLNFHALRHSNAIWLLQKGATIHEVAQHLGNRVEITERYYAGFVLRKESLERLKGLL
jgi:integrase